MLNPEYSSVPDRGDCLSKSWNLFQLLYLDTLRDTFFRTQGCNVILLAAAPQDFDARNGGGDPPVPLGRVEDKEPDGIITSGLKTREGENTIRPT